MKNAEATISFSEGLKLKFNKTKPGHVRFSFSSTDKETEDTNLRVKNSEVFLLDYNKSSIKQFWVLDVEMLVL